MTGSTEQGAGSGGGSEQHPAARRGLNYQPINWLLLIPLVGTLVPWFYNFTSPTIGGMPFFYWYQLLWIPISVFFTWVVFRATRSQR